MRGLTPLMAVALAGLVGCAGLSLNRWPRAHSRMMGKEYRTKKDLVIYAYSKEASSENRRYYLGGMGSGPELPGESEMKSKENQLPFNHLDKLIFGILPIGTELAISQIAAQDMDDVEYQLLITYSHEYLVGGRVYPGPDMMYRDPAYPIPVLNPKYVEPITSPK
jgi:hypothetical protein